MPGSLRLMSVIQVPVATSTREPGSRLIRALGGMSFLFNFKCKVPMDEHGTDTMMSSLARVEKCSERPTENKSHHCADLSPQ